MDQENFEKCFGTDREIAVFLLLQIAPLKKIVFFWSNPYKIEVMITSVIEILEFPNFGGMITPTTLFDSCNEIWLVTSWEEFMTS